MIAHNGINRKGEGNIPYIVHPHDVVCMLKSWGYTEEKHPITLSVAWTHDVLEDTDTPEDTFLKIGGELGKLILDGVKMLTFECPIESSNPNYGVLKNMYIKKVAQNASPEILVVKIADRLCNTLEFLANGNPKRAQMYFSYGEPLFERLAELEFFKRIRITLEEVREKLRMKNEE